MTKNLYILGLLVILLLSACSPTRRLTEGEYLLVENVIHQEGEKLNNEELSDILKQRPNRKILPFFRFHLQMYNLPSEERIEHSIVKKEKKLERRNAKRIAKGKEAKSRGKSLPEWLRDVVGEPPVILDSNDTRRSTTQLKTYLLRNGYFHGTVRDSTVIQEKKKRAKVHYFIRTKKSFHIDSIRYVGTDTRVASILNYGKDMEHLKVGDRFDVDALSNQRDAFTRRLKDKGFFLFTKDYITFQVDSAMGDHQVALDMKLASPISQTGDSTEMRHPRFRIGRVFFSYAMPYEQAKDTIYEGGFHFIDPDFFPLKRKVLMQNTFIIEGDLYAQKNVDLTYRRLSALSVLGHVSIGFQEYGELLDVYIQIRPAKRQSFAIETQGTNSGGYLGVEADLVYRHRNIFKGSETLELRMNGGAQAQALVTENTTGADDFEQENARFNTLEFGPSLSLKVPKFLLPVAQEKFSKSAAPSTVMNASYNLQDRPDFRRDLFNASFGYHWRESLKKSHQVNPIEISLIRIDKSDSFQERLERLNDRFLLDAYQDHLIITHGYTFTYNERNDPKGRNLFYFRGSARSGGSLLRLIDQLRDAPTDNQGRYRHLDIAYAHFVKTQLDFRFYRNFDEKRALASRFAAGIGVPLKNLSVLPFSESFFGGGANGMRGWQARTIGPGSYFEPVVTFDKIGDISLESNVEYRFNLFGYMDWAFFVDVGNIWLLKDDELRPRGNFELNRFISELAFDAGMGLRLDFNYFLLRFDFAAQIKDPSLPTGERWLFQSKPKYNEFRQAYNANLQEGVEKLNPYRMKLNFNLGIGYPF